MVIAQEPAKPFAASHRRLPACFPDRPEQHDVGFPLMISFTMVVRSVFVHRSTQRALSKENDLRQPLLLCRSDPSLHLLRSKERNRSESPTFSTLCTGKSSQRWTRAGPGEDRAYFRDATGRPRHLPTARTGAAPRDPFVEMSAGRSHFRIEDIFQLAVLIAR
jgi:hypothetical protein